MPYNINIIRKIDDLDPKVKAAFLAVLEEIERNVKENVKRSDFIELTQAVSELSNKVNQLAEAQKRTEQRVAELAEAQKKSEERLTRLEITVGELTEAHKAAEARLTKLEITVGELAEAQKRTAQKVEELAEAQKRTEEELRKLTMEHKETRKILGGLSVSVGYGLEDKIFPYMEKFALTEFGITAKDIRRKNIVYPNGQFDELNIYIEGDREGKKIYLIGECKAQLGKKDIKRFHDLLERIKSYLGGETYGFIVSHSIQPSVEEYLNKFYPDIRFYYSYHFEMRYRG